MDHTFLPLYKNIIYGAFYFHFCLFSAFCFEMEITKLNQLSSFLSSFDINQYHLNMSIGNLSLSSLTRKFLVLFNTESPS